MNPVWYIGGGEGVETIGAGSTGGRVGGKVGEAANSGLVWERSSLTPGRGAWREVIGLGKAES